MQEVSNIHTIGHAIQLSVAPVFLLAGVGALLAVLINRLARIIDRVHFLEREPASDESEASLARKRETTRELSRRAKLIHWAISLCTTCDLLVCVVVATLFIGAELGVDLSRGIALLFISAMFALIAGLLCFLREIALATRLIESLGKDFSLPDKQ